MQDFLGFLGTALALSFFFDLVWAVLRLPRWIGALSHRRVFGALR
jgi:hypothetical protein